MPTARTLLAGLGLAALLAAAGATTGGTAAGAAGTTTTTSSSGSSATTTTTAPPATIGSSTTAKAIMDASLAAARAQKSAHYVATNKVGTRSIQVTTDTSPTTATQQIVIRVGKQRGQMTSRYVGGVVYFRGDDLALEDYLGMPTTLASKYVGQWISFGSSTQDYKAIAKSMQLSTAVTQISLKSPLKGVGASTQGGQSVVGVRGTTTELSSKGKQGTATLYVAATGTPLPVAFTGNGKQDKKKETGSVTFSRWGEKVTTTAPAHSVRASSISS